jgi:hypothetical protein
MRSHLAFLIVPAAVGVFTWFGADAGSRSEQRTRPPDKQTTVLVELFTSEGCSSCPPADDVLSNLLRTQPIPHVRIVGFGEHVDYWDNLGWRDVFSAPTFTVRQSDYERQVFHSGSIYTPQAIVDGRFQMVGSDGPALRRAIEKAAMSPKAELTVGVTMPNASMAVGQIDVNIPAELTPAHPLDVVVAVVERNLATRVQRGENGGHLLKHSAVARTFASAGAITSSQRAFSKSVVLPLNSAWKKADVEIVAFVQGRTTKAVVGAATPPLSHDQPAK